ncbi:MAG TPA: sugar phosphate nucleotidyltransferase [Pyrinomonadaceae bacterium]|nr:sugar phosphate nucleotidyltransferase [Pyrinomonadaceae bacterium]
MVEIAALLCGGLATRIRPLTEKVPKSLIEIAGKPFIDWQLSHLKRKGIRQVVLCLGHQGWEIERFVGNGQRWGLTVKYSRDGDQLLGTGGALKKAQPYLDDPFWVLYGDSYLDFDYGKVSDYFEQEGKDKLGLMTVFANRNQWDQSNIIFKDGRICLYDKAEPNPLMEHIDYGAAILRKKALDLIPRYPYDLALLYSQLVKSGLMLGYEATERFYEIGSNEGIEDASRFFGALKT